MLVIDTLAPTLVLSLDLEDGTAIVAGVIIGTGKVVPVVLLLRVLVSAARKVETEPSSDLVGV